MLRGANPDTSHGCLIKRLEPADQVRWDAFVQSSSEATFFHRVGWSSVIRRALGHHCHYLYAEDSSGITGILPLCEIKSRLFGHALISTPFCVYGGIVARDGTVASRLRDAACNLAEKLQVDYLELRNRRLADGSWLTKNLYVTFRKAIDTDHAANFMAIPRKQRAMVRKGIDAGLKVEVDGEVGRFYDVYAESVRNLGTPVLARRFFALLQEVFSRDCEITLVTHDAKPVAAVMSFYFKDQVLPYYGGSTGAGRQVKANDFMYWAVMQRAVERGARLFDYGRSKLDTGSYHFKKHWGFEPEPLHYQYHLVRSKVLPDVSPVNPKYRLFIKAWQRLPLSVSRAVGPFIARSLG